MGRKRMKGIQGVEKMKSHHRNETTEVPRQIFPLWGSLSLVSLPTNKTGWGLTSSHDDAATRRLDHLAVD